MFFKNQKISSLQYVIKMLLFPVTLMQQEWQIYLTHCAKKCFKRDVPKFLAHFILALLFYHKDAKKKA